MSKLMSFVESGAGKKALFCSGALTVLFESVETFVLLDKIQKEAGGLTAFDSKPGNDRAYMQAFLDALSEEGRALYAGTYLKMDNLYPCIYTSFFVLLMAKLNGKADWKLLVPLLTLCFDYGENYGTKKMLETMTVSEGMARFASTCTNAKMACLTGTAALLGLSWWQNR